MNLKSICGPLVTALTGVTAVVAVSICSAGSAPAQALQNKLVGTSWRTISTDTSPTVSGQFVYTLNFVSAYAATLEDEVSFSWNSGYHAGGCDDQTMQVNYTEDEDFGLTFSAASVKLVARGPWVVKFSNPSCYHRTANNSWGFDLHFEGDELVGAGRRWYRYQ